MEYDLLSKLIASFIFFSTNFLYLFKFFQEHLYLLFLLNYFVIFILISTIVKLKE
jgi:hypothetical protein